MVNRRKFLASMTLPPTHSGFPHLALLHGMLAASSRMVSPDFFVHEEKYWGKTDPTETVMDYHAKRSKVCRAAQTPTNEADLVRRRRLLSTKPLPQGRSSFRSLKR